MMNLELLHDSHICKIYEIDSLFLLTIFLTPDTLLSDCVYWNIKAQVDSEEIPIHYNMYESFHAALIGGMGEIMEYGDTSH